MMVTVVIGLGNNHSRKPIEPTGSAVPHAIYVWGSEGIVVTVATSSYFKDLRTDEKLSGNELVLPVYLVTPATACQGIASEINLAKVS